MLMLRTLSARTNVMRKIYLLVLLTAKLDADQRRVLGQRRAEETAWHGSGSW